MLIPWADAKKSLASFESDPGTDAALRALSELEKLKDRQGFPGVKKNLDEMTAQFYLIRNKYMDGLLDRGNLEKAKELMAACPAVDPARQDEELVKMAFFAARRGDPFISVAKVRLDTIARPLQPMHLAAAFHELESRADKEAIRDHLLTWLRYQKDSLKPNFELVRRFLADGDTAAAIQHVKLLDESLYAQLLAKLENDSFISPHYRAFFFIQIGETSRALPLLNKIIEENPNDEWALRYHATLADSSGDTKAARQYYARLLEQDPNQPTISRRLAELARAHDDLEEARRRYDSAWEGGDLEAGLCSAELGLKDDPRKSREIALIVLERSDDPGSILRLVDIFLALESPAPAARAMRSLWKRNIGTPDDMINKAHAYVETHKNDRIPLLQLLSELCAYQGYPAEYYRLMEAQELVEKGDKSGARDILFSLMATKAKWKAVVQLAKLALTENQLEQSKMAREIEPHLSEAEGAGAGIWPDVAYHVALLWEASGKYEKAITLYEALMAREYQYRDVGERLSKIQVLQQRSSLSVSKPGQSESRYDLIDLLGSGSMGSVYKARDRKLDRILALKLLSLDANEEAQNLLVREARTTAKLNHPNIVSVYDVGKEQGKWFIAMEFIDGPTLRAVLNRGPLPASDTYCVMMALLAALENAHANGVIHRDIKPANLMIRDDVIKPENVKLTDFGLARANMEASIIMKGVVVGTASYMSPEQIQNQNVDSRADLYSSGCVFYELLAGKPLFKADNIVATMNLHMTEDPARLMDDRIRNDPSLSAVFLRLLARDPAARYVGAGECIKDIQQVMATRP